MSDELTRYLAQQRETLRAATPRPWWNESGTVHAPAWWPNPEPGAACHPADCQTANGRDPDDDAALIVSAVNDREALLDAVELLAEMRQSKVIGADWSYRADAVLSRLTADSEGVGT